MTCRDCLHYLPSTEASTPRPGLVGYGYCKAAPTPEGRAAFFHDSQQVCLLSPVAFHPVRKPS